MSNINNVRSTSLAFFKKHIIWLSGFTILLLAGILALQAQVKAADVVVYKSPTCGCCSKWVEHMEKNGYSVEVHDVKNVNPIKDKLGIPGQLRSCHTAKIGGYLIEGHVPASDIAQLLKTKPDVAGLATPGMPMGSPGMEGPRKVPYDVMSFTDNGSSAVYSSHNQR